MRAAVCEHLLVIARQRDNCDATIATRAGSRKDKHDPRGTKDAKMIDKQKPESKKLDPALLTCKAAAAYGGISVWSLRQLVAAGEIDAKQFGRRVLPVFKSVRAYFDRLPDALPAKRRSYLLNRDQQPERTSR
jgi:hypothetical protein